MTEQTLTYQTQRIEALERQVELLKAAIKETWGFIDYKRLPLSLEMEIQRQPTLTEVSYNRRLFKQLHKLVLEEATRILHETNEPVHYTVIVQAVERKHTAFLQKAWTRNELGDKANLPGKVRDLACQGWLKRVGKGTYFYGPKMATLQKV